MSHSKKHRTSQHQQHKQIRAWAVRRKQVDIEQLALAYYLLARIRIEHQKQHEACSAKPSEDEAAHGVSQSRRVA
jgi:hypothetical protein